MPTLRGALRRARGAFAPSPDPFGAYMAHVEPALAARPRVHRFAAPVIEADAGAPGEPVRAAEAGGRAEALAALEAGGWVALYAPGDELAPIALERLGQAAALAPDAALITADEDRLGGDGGRRDPVVRPGPSPDLMLAVDGFGSLLCVDADRARAALAHCADGPAWRYELALRLAGPDGAGHAHTPVILNHRRELTAVDDEAEAEAAARAPGAEGARVERTGPARRRIRRALAGEPSVEAIVLFRDKPELLRRCVRSVLEASSYERLGVCLVDNGSAEPETAALVAELAAEPRVRALRDERPFNFAALNNVAVAGSQADFVVFLNNDTEVISETWVEDLLEEAARPAVGAVAPLLTYPDGTVQHAGAALGLHGFAGHPFAGLRPDAPTPFGAAADGTRNWLAVTAACLMVARAKFDAVGGFDETFIVAGNDVDLCLRLTLAGQRSLCVPHARLLHDESQSRGAHIDPQDFERSIASYGSFRTVGDPFYNPSLTLEATDCSLRAPVEITP